jgi:hypothetical protein
MLTAYLNDGGRLLLSGQNIVDDIGDEPFLTDVLDCLPGNPDTDIRVAYGIGGEPIFGDAHVVMVGSQGANNQTSPSSVIPQDGATLLLTYADSIASPAAIATTYGTGQVVFMGFGIEAVTRVSGSWTRHQLLSAVMTWFDSTSFTPGMETPLPNTFLLMQNYPNPFNPSTAITFAAPLGERDVTLTIYDLLGRQVSELFNGIGSGTPVTVHWNGRTDSGLPLSTGTYYYVLRAGHQTTARPLQLIK